MNLPEAMDHNISIIENSVIIDKKTTDSLTKSVQNQETQDTTTTKIKQPCYRCKICPYLSLRKPYLVRHMQQKHGFSTVKVSDNSSHSDNIENVKGLEKCIKSEDTLCYDGTELSCKICNFKTSHLHLFNLHQEVHENVEKEVYQCTQCKFSTEVVKALQEHERTHKQTVLFACPKCDYASRLKCNLKAHLKTHENQSTPAKFRCDFCENFESSYYSAFVRHMKHKHHRKIEKIHEGQEDAPMFKCEECDFVTYREHTIKRHVNRHTERRKEGDEVILKETEDGTETVWFCCNICAFRSTEQRYVILHKKVHARVDEFNRNAAMLVHSKRKEAKDIQENS